MSSDFPIPPTKVLAIASHVVYGYVGNTMATFVMQALGCEVAAMNTVHFSNHTGYTQFTGRRNPSSELTELYAGLRQSYLTDFNVLLSGYAPSASVVDAIGTIARDLRYRAATRPGSFFWILDPVMGDSGRLYVSEDVVPRYKQLCGEADMIVPNAFEAELLSGVEIKGLKDVGRAIGGLHAAYGVRHVVVTSVKIDERGEGERLAVVGSTSRKDGSARCFKIEVPRLGCFFSGTGDMFAALMVGRFREECGNAGLLGTAGWVGGDEVEAVELPLAKATEKVLASMQVVLEKTMTERDEEMKRFGESPGASIGGVEGEGEYTDVEKRKHLAESKAAEVRVVRNWRDLVHPEVKYKAEVLEVDGEH